ncbi:MAG: DNA methyltransferase [Thermomicrobiales bacterium]
MVRQLTLIDDVGSDEPTTLDARLWSGSFNGRESSLHQLAPYVGKLKSGMVRVLIQRYSKQGDVVFDPFSGSGVVPLESLLLGRRALANDLSPYAYVLTMGKVSAPPSKIEALRHTREMLDDIERESKSCDVHHVPEWVAQFFHPETLKEVVTAFATLRQRKDYFLLACMLGILHHVRPGFLSYPASHMTPYLRPQVYPRDQHPKMYEYRALRPRLIAKVERAYRREQIHEPWGEEAYHVLQVNAMHLPVSDDSVDSIISSPPYFGALDYARDNRLRLWFLGVEDWKAIDNILTASDKVYVPQMIESLKEMYRVLKPEGYCVLVLGDVERNGKIRNTSSILSELATQTSDGKLETQFIFTDEIPDDRRSRRETKTTKFERILVMKKIG